MQLIPDTPCIHVTIFFYSYRINNTYDGRTVRSRRVYTNTYTVPIRVAVLKTRPKKCTAAVVAYDSPSERTITPQISRFSVRTRSVRYAGFSNGIAANPAYALGTAAGRMQSLHSSPNKSRRTMRRRRAVYDTMCDVTRDRVVRTCPSSDGLARSRTRTDYVPHRVRRLGGTA